MPTPATSATRALPRAALFPFLVALGVSIALAGSPSDEPAAVPADALPIEEAQVEAGRSGYAHHCAVCHGAQLEGMAHFPTLRGATFQRRWAERTLGELYTYVHDLMPLGAGGSLDEDSYAAIVAYLLARNGVEAGETPFDPENEGQFGLPLAIAGWTDGG
ncbi:MAG: c-type cytochrome [Trueperaceae bacterium]